MFIEPFKVPTGVVHSTIYIIGMSIYKQEEKIEIIMFGSCLVTLLNVQFYFIYLFILFSTSHVLLLYSYLFNKFICGILYYSNDGLWLFKENIQVLKPYFYFYCEILLDATQPVKNQTRFENDRGLQHTAEVDQPHVTDLPMYTFNLIYKSYIKMLSIQMKSPFHNCLLRPKNSVGVNKLIYHYHKQFCGKSMH